jgi:hypothetical protein
MMRSSRKAQKRKRANRLPFSDENNMQDFFTGRALASATLYGFLKNNARADSHSARA